MSSSADVGTGTTITFGTSGSQGALLSISGPSASRPSIETTDMSTTTAHTFMPGDLVDHGEVTLTVEFDPDIEPAITSGAETVTITWPIPSGLSNGATWQFSAFITGFEPSASIDERMEMSITLKISGDITYADAS